MQNIRVQIFMLCLIGLLPLTANSATRVPLNIDDPAQLDTPWPLVGGVPFPPGDLTDPARCRIVDSAGVEVLAQIDRTATWQDGSVRWLSVSMVARTAGDYALEFGPEVRRAPVDSPLVLAQTQEGYSIDTGMARFSIRDDALGLDSAVLTGGGVLWADGAGTVYAIDSQGRRAVCAGPEADVHWQVAVNGPVRVVLRGDGHYVTAEGQRVARATVWYWFFRGCAQVKIVHTFVLTQDTDELWFREIGWQIPFQPTGQAQATFDTAKSYDWTVNEVPLVAGTEVRACQEQYPHFLERGSRYRIAAVTEETAVELDSGDALGEWFNVTGQNAGLTLVVRDLAEQFPKELVASRESGMTVKLWTSVDGRELDFRLDTLIPNYFGEWATTFPNAGKTFYRQPSNATGAAKTHEMWLLPHRAPFDLQATARQARAADERVLLLPDPKWTCESCVLHPSPIQEKDAERFPLAEAMMSDYFDRVTLGLRAFPTTGFIAWGCNPFLQYRRTGDGRWYAGYYRLQYLIEYNLRRNAWLMFARSGERKYYEYVSRFDWFAADWSMHHEDFGKKVRGGFARQGNYHYPIFWGERSEVLYTESSGTDLFNWYTNYYLTGDLRSLEVVHEFRDAVLREWETAKQEQKYVAGGSAGFMTLRLLVQLYMEGWKPTFREMIDEWAHGLLDLDSPNGITDKQPYGCLYKVSRNLCSILEYWWVTQDPLAKQCYLKAVDYNRRFARVQHPITYQNGQAAFYTQAYLWTGDTDWLRVPKALVDTGIAEFAAGPTLQEQLEPGLDSLQGLPYLGPHTNLHPLYSMPIAMKALSNVEQPIGPPAWAVRGEADVPGWIVVRKTEGQARTLEIAYDVVPEAGFDPLVLDAAGEPVAEVEVTVEPQHYWTSPTRNYSYVPKPGEPWRVNARILLPAKLPGGDYRTTIAGNGRMVVVGADAEHCVLECPDGLVVGTGSVYGSHAWFHVPADVPDLRLFCTNPLTLTRPGGAIERIDTPGAVTVRTDGQAGMWSVSAAFPTFLRLESVPSVVAAAPELYFVPAQLHPPTPVPEPIPADVLFVPGPIGQARHLPGETAIEFPRGAPRADGGFDNFPGYEGTIEFYFRPNWSSHELVFNDRMVYRSFVRSNSTRVYYRYGKGPMRGTMYAYFDLLIPGRGEGYANDYGNAFRILMKKGQWYHFATTWKIDREAKKTVTGEFTLFLNGEKKPRGRFYPNELKAQPPFSIRDIAETLFIGPMDGCIDELRISDIVRYTADFPPPTAPFEPDEHTTALFHFEGQDTGWLRD